MTAHPNLLPVPRFARLGDTLVDPAEPEVHVGTAGLPPEGYAIRITADGSVTVDAADPAGAAHAQRTLTQLARTHEGRLPVGTVDDSPALAVRGVMLDISRDKVPTMDTLRGIVDRLAEWKINHLELYAEHTFAYRDHEVVWRDASPLTATEVRELDAYCAARHIELVPNQNCLGHMNRWLQHAPYAPLAMAPAETPEGVPPRPPSTVEPSDPGTLALVRGLLAELLPNFSSQRFVNVGLDEPWEMPETRIGDYLAWVRTLRALPELHGRQMLMWGDVLAADPERIRALPEGVTVCEWGYDAGHPFDERARTYAECGRPCWTAPGTSSWTSILGRVTNMRTNCLEAVEAAHAHGGDGVLVTDWGDQGHLQYLPISDPGFAYGAAVAWDPDANRDLDLAAALSTHCFTDPSGLLGEALVRLGDAHRLLGSQLGNLATLTMPLYYPQLALGRWPLKHVTSEEYTAVEAELDACLALLERSSSERPDHTLVLDELRNAIALVRVACADARARLVVDGTLAAVPAAERDDCAAALRPVIEEHDRLWRARNRTGGLEDSRAWLEHLLHCYETGTVVQDWTGPRAYP